MPLVVLEWDLQNLRVPNSQMPSVHNIELVRGQLPYTHTSTAARRIVNSNALNWKGYICKSDIFTRQIEKWLTRYTHILKEQLYRKSNSFKWVAQYSDQAPSWYNLITLKERFISSCGKCAFWQIYIAY